MRADGIGDVAWRKMCVVLFRHAGVGVAGDDTHRHAAHGERRAVGNFAKMTN
jgi:hypothetical protein